MGCTSLSLISGASHFFFNLWRVATMLLLPKREFNKPWGDTFRLFNITYPLKGAIPSDFAIEQTIVGIKGEPHPQGGPQARSPKSVSRQRGHDCRPSSNNSPS